MKYSTGAITTYKPFKFWNRNNDKQLHNDFNWYGAFELRPLFELTPVKVAIHNQIIYEQLDRLDWWNKDHKRMTTGFKTDSQGHLKQPNSVMLSQNRLERLLAEYESEINQIDTDIFNVLKPYVYEAEQKLTDNREPDNPERWEFMQSVKWLGIMVRDHWIELDRETFKNTTVSQYSSPEMVESVVNGLDHYQPKKEPLLAKYAKLLEKYLIHSRAIHVHFLGKATDVMVDKTKILRNETAKEMVNRGDEINNHYNDEIIKQAKKMLADNRDKCLTKSGNASSHMYKTIRRKLKSMQKSVKPPSESTVKNRLNDWLDKWINNGKL